MSTSRERPAVTDELCGLEAIARRMQTTPETIIRWYATDGFPMFRRRHQGRWTWVAHETSIALWQTGGPRRPSAGERSHD